MPAHLRVSRPAKRRISGIQPNPDELALSPWSSEHHKRYRAQPNPDAIGEFRTQARHYGQPWGSQIKDTGRPRETGSPEKQNLCIQPFKSLWFGAPCQRYYSMRSATAIVVLGFALPGRHDPPAEVAQECLVAGIPNNIALRFVLPIFHALLGAGRVLAVGMPVPKNPCMKMIDRYRGNTVPRQPGRSLRCNRKRNPSA